MAARKIPRYIGVIPIPESRSVTIQLLKCWGELIDEYKNIEPMFKDLPKRLPSHMFVAGAQDIAMHLATIMDDKKLPATRTDLIYVGEPKSQLGFINCKVAGILHRFFDEPDYVIKGKHRPIIKTSGDAKQAMEDCCEEKKEITAQ
jgi:hypothetical protein